MTQSKLQKIVYSKIHQTSPTGVSAINPLNGFIM